MSLTDDRVRFGAAYYHEYHRPGEDPRPERLAQDLDQMAAAGFTVIRVGESVWTTWEPEEGRFDLDWLQPVLDGAHEQGIDVVLGTPTYALPPWMVRRYPEVAGEDATGRRMGWGARQEADFTHPVFRFHAERVLRKIVERYRDHPAVVGWQVDNEPGLHLLHNHGIFQRFVDHLRAEYGDVETLNREWGLVYWSHRLSTWADLWTPDGNAQPQYDLAWRRFQAGLTTEMIAWQADAVRALARDDQAVTTCIAYDRPALEDVELSRALDVTSGNAYFGMQDALEHPGVAGAPQAWTVRGTWALFQAADMMFSSKDAPFLVTETNAQAIGGPENNFPAYRGQWRQAAWALVARGARMVEYWHWHTLHYGTETYWGGVVPHNGRPGRTYRELAQIGAELGTAGPLLASARPDADVGIVYSSEARWALAAQPSLTRDDGTADTNTYPRVVSAFYRGAFDAGLQARVVRPAALFDDSPADVAARLPVLVAAALYTATDAQLDWLLAYAEAGGHLVLGPRTGYADHEARARTDVQPARLSGAAGVWYEEFTNLLEPVRVVSPGERADGAPDGARGLDVPAGATAEAWVDCLLPGSPDAGGAGGAGEHGATVLARYDHPHLGEFAAVTTRVHGAGRVTTVGTVPGVDLARAVVGWAAPAPLAGWQDLPASVTVSTSTTADGRRVHVVHNWSWDRVEVTAPAGLELVVRPGHGDTSGADDVPAAGASVSAGERVALGAWDVLVAVTAG
ncbi:hypothetical protein GCM10025865_10960 [Paraoerskovia sediminicola]|uniref:beta-galactosidase n=1 Tax=Paraoerskovia sediminicola TaxID=1138587 RepID=A0ABM8G1E1_9CELL|nr:beta-galactosidase [Paraoerskovia sediminicola]BDZ41797.1 hypothetical protein GCM10025865_10960 [Paraoerskovia sediminicola]